MKVNNSEKLVWKYKCTPFYYLISIFIGSFLSILILITILIGVLGNYEDLLDIKNIIIIILLAFIIPLYLLYRWGKYFFILRVKKSKFSIKPKLLSFTKRFDLLKIKSIEFLLTRTRFSYSPHIIGRDVNLLYIYITINIKDLSEKTHTFNIIRFYNYETTADAPFIDKKNAMKSKFINALEDLKHLLPNLILIKDEIKEEFEIFKKNKTI
ncbi:MAG: hypothetical protein EU529_14035 [Promethearchaeota archaeon]|nr:MAG: hypothetical protein EU529_14035 [Candidatus Lokiarchaeota archaeon]